MPSSKSATRTSANFPGTTEGTRRDSSSGNVAPGQSATDHSIAGGSTLAHRGPPVSSVSETRATSPAPLLSARATNSWSMRCSINFAPEHLEVAVRHVAPGEIEEAITLPALDRRPEEVDAVGSRAQFDLDLPTRCWCVAGKQIVGILANLNTHVDVLEELALGIAGHPTR